MSRRKDPLFNLSFLDLLTSALGAIIFLFIITPKGGAPASEKQQIAIYYDTVRNQIFGDLPDSLRYKSAGDTLLTILVDYRQMPGTEKEKAYPDPKPARPEQVAIAERRPQTATRESSKTAPERSAKVPKDETRKDEKAPVSKKETEPKKETPPPVFRGDAPSVPCKVSFEINWTNEEDNVDLFVCKGGSCVYGGNKRDRNIGQWDSGKSRNRIFGNDLRTNQEAVRQFDGIIPGEYKLYAEYKESKRNKPRLSINGLIYTKNSKNEERGDSFSANLNLNKGRTLIGTVTVFKDGSFNLKKQ